MRPTDSGIVGGSTIDINVEGSPTRDVTLLYVPRTAAPTPGVIEKL